jgi:hypothetical protein
MKIVDMYEVVNTTRRQNIAGCCDAFDRALHMQFAACQAASTGMLKRTQQLYPYYLVRWVAECPVDPVRLHRKRSTPISQCMMIRGVLASQRNQLLTSTSAEHLKPNRNLS